MTTAPREATAEEKAKWTAEAEAAKALARKHDADAEGLRLENEGKAISLEQLRLLHKSEMARDRYHHSYLLQGQVTQNSVESCIKSLMEWHRNDPGCDIEIVIDSPGGSVFAGFRLFDTITFLRDTGHNITTIAVGMAASMGSILLQAGTSRKMTSNSFVLLHEISTGAQGKVGDIEDTMELMKKLEDRSLAIFSKRSGLTPTKLKNMQRRKDLWLSAEECLKLGLVDEVIY